MKSSEKDIKAKIIKLYKEGISNKDLAKKFNIHRTTVQRLLKKEKVKLHKRKSTLICNKMFFMSYTKESCYWAGFILADGYIRKSSSNLHIKLHKKDTGHLINFLKCLDISEKDILNMIKYRENYSFIDLFISELITGLEKLFSIVNKKSLIAKIDNKIPKRMLRHFIRGYFDGDGSISSIRGAYPVISFTGTINTLNKIIEFCIENKIKENHVPKILIRYHGIIGSFAYYGKDFLKKYYNVLYKDSNEKIELKRKKEKIISFL